MGGIKSSEANQIYQEGPAKGMPLVLPGDDNKVEIKDETVAANEEAKKQIVEEFELAVQTILERTGNDPEVITILNKFVNTLGTNAFFGSSVEPMSETRKKLIAATLRSAIEEMTTWSKS